MWSWRHRASPAPNRARTLSRRPPWAAIVLITTALAGCGQPASFVESTPDPATADASSLAAPVTPEPTPELIETTLGQVEFAPGEITPPEIVLGGVVVSLSLHPARHLADQTTMQVADAAQRQQAAEARRAALAAPEGARAPLVQGSAVLAGMARATNNLDPSQAIPADSVDTRIRHAIVRVQTRDGQPVPYLTLTMDVLLDGRPTSFEQALLPMTPIDGNVTELYYGNNVKFGLPGTYQLFVRMQRSPLLGQDQPQAALFNLIMR
jgi:hypothetical protein